MHEKMVKEFADVMAGIEKPAVMLDFLRAILTPQELDRIALRWRLVKMLKHGVKQRAIASKLGVSLCKITRGSRELKSGPKGFRDVVEKEMAKERKKK